MKPNIPVAILIPNYNGKHLLADCLSSLFRSAYTGLEVHVYVVDNASTDGSVAYVESTYPDVRCIALSENRGFTGANNAGWTAANKEIDSLAYVYLLNSDTIAERNFLKPLVDYMETDEKCMAAQSLLLLHPDTDRVNSRGNRIHYLGFGYAEGSGERYEHNEKRRPIDYPSGAGVLLRASYVCERGLFDDMLFMYLEDLDLGWQMRLSGYSCVMIPESIVYHKFEFSRSMRQYYYFERNRLWMVLKNYRLRTLLLLLPAIIMMEAGQWLFALMRKTAYQKLRSYGFFLLPSTWRLLARERKKVASYRVVSDRAVLETWSGVILYQPLDTFLLRRIANPLFDWYRRCIIRFVSW